MLVDIVSDHKRLGYLLQFRGLGEEWQREAKKLEHCGVGSLSAKMKARPKNKESQFQKICSDSKIITVQGPQRKPG